MFKNFLRFFIIAICLAVIGGLSWLIFTDDDQDSKTPAPVLTVPSINNNGNSKSDSASEIEASPTDGKGMERQYKDTAKKLGEVHKALEKKGYHLPAPDEKSRTTWNPGKGRAKTDSEDLLLEIFRILSNPIKKKDRSFRKNPKKDMLYKDIVSKAAKRYNLDPFLIHAIIKIESNYDTNAVSPKKNAKGLMQLMPGTQKDMGVKNPFDPQENIFGGTRYFKMMLSEFKTYPESLKAYNFGPNAVKKGRKIPQETRSYVKNVMSTWQMMKSSD
ncbi:MAG: lytic transglycosylase domain-containing protein [Desulfobacula sp.]|jgi:hypothetical protein|nr:lytic transglycosylase domain-containing protein [Desulfobacula sp.]